jgi:hypothetical protein
MVQLGTSLLTHRWCSLGPVLYFCVHLFLFCPPPAVLPLVSLMLALLNVLLAALTDLCPALVRVPSPPPLPLPADSCVLQQQPGGVRADVSRCGPPHHRPVPTTPGVSIPRTHVGRAGMLACGVGVVQGGSRFHLAVCAWVPLRRDGCPTRGIGTVPVEAIVGQSKVLLTLVPSAFCTPHHHICRWHHPLHALPPSFAV